MKILVSNDDGVDAEGIRTLGKAMGEMGEVVIVAPHRERSTAGHSLTLHKPLRINEVAKGIYSTSGTPADCIYLGIREVLGDKPDLILSGINRGANLGTDIYYSGTVAAAREGALMNIPSIAISLVDLRQLFPNSPAEPFRFDLAADVTLAIVKKLKPFSFPKHCLININIPNLPREKIKGVKVSHMGFRYYENEVTRRKDPRGKDYYWIGGGYLGFEPGDRTDCHAVNEGYVSLTPLIIDCTHNKYYTTLKDFDFTL